MSETSKPAAAATAETPDDLQALRAEVAQLRQERARAQERVIQAELRAAATQAGMIDLDGLKMADHSTVKLDESGAVQGAEALLAGLRQNKPYLFPPAGARNSSSNPGGAPAPAGTRPRHASEMSKEEFERELKKLTRR